MPTLPKSASDDPSGGAVPGVGAACPGPVSAPGPDKDPGNPRDIRAGAPATAGASPPAEACPARCSSSAKHGESAAAGGREPEFRATARPSTFGAATGSCCMTDLLLLAFSRSRSKSRANRAQTLHDALADSAQALPKPACRLRKTPQNSQPNREQTLHDARVNGLQPVRRPRLPRPVTHRDSTPRPTRHAHRASRCACCTNQLGSFCRSFPAGRVATDHRSMAPIRGNPPPPVGTVPATPRPCGGAAIEGGREPTGTAAEPMPPAQGNV